MIAHGQHKGTVQKGPGLRDRDAVTTLPLVIVDVRDGDAVPRGKQIKRRAHILGPVAGHHKEALHASLSGPGDHPFEQRHSVHEDQRLALTPLPQASTRPGGDDEAVHGRTALNLAVLLRMNVSTIS